MNRVERLVYFSLSLLMMGLAMSHLSNVVPWVDEVMFTDTAMHFMNGKGWTTNAWYSVAKQEPFLLYPPLYTMIMVLWMIVFGTTLIACRSMNLTMTLLIGWGIIRICMQLGTHLSKKQMCLFIMLLWCTEDMIYMYSNGRPDLLGAAILVWIVSEMICIIKNNKKGWTIIVLLSVLLAVSGIQEVVCLYILILLAYLLLKDQRKSVKRVSVLAAFGTFIGFLLVCAFMACHGHLIAFVVNMLSYSNTLMNLAMIGLPVLGNCLGIDFSLFLEKIANNTTDVTFYRRIMTIYTHPTYVALLGIILFVFLSEHKKLKSCSLYVTMKFLLVFVLSIPLLMNLAGRFPDYYYWMAYIPVFLFVVILVGFTKNRISHLIIGLVLLFISAKGSARSFLQDNYSMTAAFISRCAMLKNKYVVAPFSVFYEMEKLGSNAYYLGVYPTRYIPKDIEYVILPQKNSDYGVSHLYDYYESIQESDSLQTVMVAESTAVGLKVYKIIRKPQYSSNNP